MDMKYRSGIKAQLGDLVRAKYPYLNVSIGSYGLIMDFNDPIVVGAVHVKWFVDLYTHLLWVLPHDLELVKRNGKEWMTWV